MISTCDLSSQILWKAGLVRSLRPSCRVMRSDTIPFVAPGPRELRRETVLEEIVVTVVTDGFKYTNVNL